MHIQLNFQHLNSCESDRPTPFAMIYNINYVSFDLYNVLLRVYSSFCTGMYQFNTNKRHFDVCA